MSEWIKCSDRLPEKEDDYLTYVMDNGCSYNYDVQRFYSKPRILKGMYADVLSRWENQLWDDNIVICWMELPKPPEVS